jgi:hypothetical protein
LGRCCENYVEYDKDCEKREDCEAKTTLRKNTATQKQKKEGDEPDPRHWWKTAVAASFPT